MLATRVARLIDRLLRDPTRRNWVSAVLLAVVLPLCAAIDMLLRLPDFGTERLILLAWTVATLPLTITAPDVAAYHYLDRPPRNASYQNPLVANGAACSATADAVYRPATIQQVATIVRRAAHTNSRVTVAGTRYSQGAQTLAPRSGRRSVLVDMSGIRHVCVDARNKTAVAGAGATWYDVQDAANRHGLAPRAQQGSAIFSVGGAVSVNCHGWDHHAGPICTTLLYLTVVQADGRITRVWPGEAAFACAVGGYGLAGVVAEACLQLAPNFALERRTSRMSSDEYADYFYRNVAGDRSRALHTFRLSVEPGGLLRSGDATDFRIAGTATSAKLEREDPRGSLGERLVLHLARRFGWVRALAWRWADRSVATKPRNAWLRASIGAAQADCSAASADWLLEFFVPPARLAPFLRDLGRILDSNGVALLNATVRFARRDRLTLLAYAGAGDRFAVVLYFCQPLAPREVGRTIGWVREAIDCAIASGGSYYLPYAPIATRAQFDACYDARAFRNAKSALDPRGVFDTGFYRRYIAEDALLSL